MIQRLDRSCVQIASGQLSVRLRRNDTDIDPFKIRIFVTLLDNQVVATLDDPAAPIAEANAGIPEFDVFLDDRCNAEAVTVVARLKAEQEILGFPVSDHPLSMFPGVMWDSYCPISSLGDNHGERVSIAGMIIEDRIHRQENGQPMKFISVCDNTSIIECELFADVHRRYGTETIRHPIVEVTGRVIPFANGNGHTLQVQKVGKARVIP
ncbi:hypothetical protein BH09VER1_BH09VER1_17720 [soil metagenome]